MIEDDIRSLEKDVGSLNERFDKLVSLLHAAFGDDVRLQLEAQNATLKRSVEAWKSAREESHGVLVEVATALGLRGGFGKKDLLKAVAKLKARKK